MSLLFYSVHILINETYEFIVLYDKRSVINVNFIKMEFNRINYQYATSKITFHIKFIHLSISQLYQSK